VLCLGLVCSCTTLDRTGVKTFSISPVEAHEKAGAGDLTIIDIRPGWERTRDGVATRAAVVVYEAAPSANPRFIDEVTGVLGGERNRAVALLCRQGIIAIQARTVLHGAGFLHVFVVDGGFLGSESDPGWVQWGLPVETVPRSQRAH
jgi:rhodanese-related sulfurtransferase